MNLIYDILRKLRKQELQHLRQRLKNGAFAFEKLEKLFDLVTRHPEKSEEFYSDKVYGHPPDNTFRVAKSRLKRMLENVILRDKSLHGYRSAVINARLQARKKLLQGEILLGRGAYQASRNLLHQVISTARRYDLEQEHFQAELLLYRHESIRSSVKEYARQTEDLLQRNRTLFLINENEILQKHIANLLLHKTLKTKEMTGVRAKIDQMHRHQQETPHPQVAAGYLLTENYYHQVQGNFEQARAFGEQYLDLLEKTPSLQLTPQLANAYAQLAKISLQLGQLEQARSYADEVLQRYQPQEMNYLVMLELRFRLEFYDQQVDAALKVVDEALAHPLFDNSPILAARWHYFHACVRFLLGEFQLAYAELDHTPPLLSDRYGMSVYIRLLEIMLLFELGHKDILETKIMNMKQYVKRTQQKQVGHRPGQLIQLLLRWLHQHYDFAQTLHKTSRLPAPAGSNPDAPYDPSDFELIRLEEWMQGKIVG